MARSRTRNWFALCSLALAALLWVGLLRTGQVELEDRWLPWRPLHVADSPNWLTPFKLGRLASHPGACREVLAGSQIQYSPLEDKETAPGCGFSNAVLVSATSASVGDAFALSCPAAVALALWEQHSLQPEAEAVFGLPIVRIEHFGSYACRNLYGRSSGPRSRHATANAFDIAGFVLADGRRIRVLADWNEASPESDFLHRVRDGGCAFFDTVLSPDYNAAHRDHLHVDTGRWGTCR